jgi:hypothetical protein
MSNIVIDIAAQFTGKKAFSASEKAINNLSRSIKRAALGGGIAALMKSSVKAFAEDEKAAALLGNTLKNLGLEAFTASIEAMIDKTQLATGVLDEQLRPAFQKLATSTGSAIKAQELLSLALDVSAGSTVDLVTVASDIANVMAGNNKGLKKYALGLSAVELKTITATEVQLKFMEVYGGASEKASKTFAGSMLRIKASAEMARESLGKGLVDGLMIATGSQNIDELQKKITDFGKSAGNTFKTLGTIIRDNLGLLKSLAVTFAAIWTVGKVIAGITAVQSIIKALTASYKLLRATAVGTAIAQMAVLNPIGAAVYGVTLIAAITAATISVNKLEEAFGSASDAADKLAEPRLFGGFYADKYLKEKAAAEAKSLKDKLAKEKAAAKAIADAKLKKDKEAAANLAKLAKANSLFDLDKIQIEAALKGKISEEEKTRLLLMRAILEEDAATAETLEKKLADIQKKNTEIAADLAIIAATKDPFATWAGSLALALVELGKYGKGLADVPNLVPGVDFNPNQNADRNYDTKVAAVTAAIEALASPAVITSTNNIPTIGKTTSDLTTNMPTPTSGGFGFSLPSYITSGQNFAGGAYTPPAPVTVIVEGSVLDGDDFVEKVNQAFVNAQRKGYSQFPAGSLP